MCVHARLGTEFVAIAAPKLVGAKMYTCATACAHALYVPAAGHGGRAWYMTTIQVFEGASACPRKTSIAGRAGQIGSCPPHPPWVRDSMASTATVHAINGSKTDLTRIRVQHEVPQLRACILLALIGGHVCSWGGVPVGVSHSGRAVSHVQVCAPDVQEIASPVKLQAKIIRCATSSALEGLCGPHQRLSCSS